MTKNSDKRALFITPRFPLPLKSGTQIREYHALHAIDNQFDTTLLSLVQSREEADSISELSDTSIDVYTVEHMTTKPKALLRFVSSFNPYRVCKFHSSQLERKTQQLLNTHEYDLIWVNFLNMMSVIPETVSRSIVLDEHNSDIRYWKSFLQGTVAERLFAYENIRRLGRFQSSVANQISAVLSVSPDDAHESRSWMKDAPVWTVPNGINISEFKPTRPATEATEVVLFVGSLDVRMNEEAVKWFVEHAWPTVRARRPEATFNIVGRNPTQRVRSLDESDGVEVVGEVPDVRPFYDNAAVIVAPFQFGGGTKLKVLEALAMERGLVTSPKGVTGLDLVDGEHLLIRERNEKFADAVIELLANADERAQLGRNGRQLVCRRYDWNSIMASAIDQVCEHLL